MNTVNTETAIMSKSSSLENTKNSKNTIQFSDPQVRKENISKTLGTIGISLAIWCLCNSC